MDTAEVETLTSATPCVIRCEITPEILGIKGIAEAVSQASTIGHLINELKNLDVDPPYQRGDVWRKQGKQGLIRALALGIPIGAVHLVQKNKALRGPKWVLDGKQRITTIKSFVEDKLRVEFEINGKSHKVTWSEIQNEEHPCHDLVSRICGTPIQLCNWGPMGFDAQRDVFRYINYSTPLNGEENVYCDHYMTARLLTYWFESYVIKRLEQHMHKRLLEDRRFTGIKLLHCVLLLAYGPSFNDRFIARELKNKKLAESADAIEKLFVEKGFTANTDINPDIVKQLGFKRVDEDIKHAVEWFAETLEFKNGLSKRFEVNVILEMLTFFVYKSREQIITNNYFKQNKGLFHRLLEDWCHAKDREPAIKERAADVGSLKFRFEMLDEIARNLGIDMEQKNNSRISDTQRALVLLGSNPVDPVSGEALTDKNVQIDHVVPSSTVGEFSDGELVAVSSTTNGLKSGLTPETLEKMAAFVRANIHRKSRASAGRSVPSPDPTGVPVSS